MGHPRHFVAVGALVRNEQGDILLKLHPARGWEFPGGRVEKGEDLIAALQREVLEETGFHVKVGELVGLYSNKHSPGVLITFLAKSSGGSAQASDESLEVKWFSPDEVLSSITHPAVADEARDMLEFSGTVIYRVFTADMTSRPETASYRIHMTMKV